MSETMNVAAIDLGSAKAKFVVASFEDGERTATLHRERQDTNLVSGMSETDRLIKPESISRLIEALSDYRKTLETLDVSRLRVIGTAAIRNADNSTDIESLVEASLGARLETLTHTQEAELFFGVVSSAIGGDIATIDVGGGSVQVSCGASGRLGSHALLDTGTLTLKTGMLRATCLHKVSLRRQENR